MNIMMVLAIAAIVGLVISYSLLEMRLNQRPCPECGFRISVDDPLGECPRCGARVTAGEPSRGESWRPDCSNDNETRPR